MVANVDSTSDSVMVQWEKDSAIWMFIYKRHVISCYCS